MISRSAKKFRNNIQTTDYLNYSLYRYIQSVYGLGSFNLFTALLVFFQTSNELRN